MGLRGRVRGQEESAVDWWRGCPEWRHGREDDVGREGERMASQEMLSQKMTSREMPSREMTSRKMTSRKMVSQEMTSQEMTSREIAPQEMTLQEKTSREIASQKIASRGDPRGRVRYPRSMLQDPLPPCFLSVSLSPSHIIHILSPPSHSYALNEAMARSE